jgi:hypothetical protein
MPWSKKIAPRAAPFGTAARGVLVVRFDLISLFSGRSAGI